MSQSPKEQHDAHAKKILARRAKKAEAKAKANNEPDPIAGNNTGNGGGDNGGDNGGDGTGCAPVDKYKGLGVKELREECTILGIEFKKKDTIAKLIEKLTA